MIYLASPYSHPDPLVRQERWRAACRAAAALIRRGRPTVSPIAHSHPICEIDSGLPWDATYWAALDMALLRACSAVYVLTIDGCRESAGVRAEIAEAQRLGMPIMYLHPDGTETPGGAW